MPKKKVATSEKFTPIEEVDKGTNNLDGMKEAVVTIRGKDLDKFEGQYIVSKGWFNIDNEWLKRNCSTTEPDFNKNFLKGILEVNILKHIKPL